MDERGSCLQKAHSLGASAVSRERLHTLESSFILYLLSVVLLTFDLYVFLFVLESHSSLSSLMGTDDQRACLPA